MQQADDAVGFVLFDGSGNSNVAASLLRLTACEKQASGVHSSMIDCLATSVTAGRKELQ